MDHSLLVCACQLSVAFLAAHRAFALVRSLNFSISASRDLGVRLLQILSIYLLLSLVLVSVFVFFWAVSLVLILILFLFLCFSDLDSLCQSLHIDISVSFSIALWAHREHGERWRNHAYV